MCGSGKKLRPTSGPSMWRGGLCESKTLRNKGQRSWCWVNVTGIWREAWSSCHLGHPLPPLKFALPPTPRVRLPFSYLFLNSCCLSGSVPNARTHWICSEQMFVVFWSFDVALTALVSSEWWTAPHIGQEARRDSLFCPDELDSLFSYFDTSSKLRSCKFCVWDLIQHQYKGI